MYAYSSNFVDLNGAGGTKKKMELEAAGYMRGLVSAEDRESVPNTKCPCMMHPPMPTMM